MRHFFITNPAAGQGKAESVFTAKIIETAKRLDISYQIHRTMGIGDGERFIKKVLAGRDEEDAEIYRFYACGGDGTLHETINGIYGKANAEAAVIPLGTGNDFVRNFPSGYDFFDVEKQIRGESVPIDLIKYQGETNVEYIEGDTGERYCVNMINMGLDCTIVFHAGQFKKYSFLSGKAAYFSAIVKSLAKKRAAVVKVYFDDGTAYEGHALLLAIGNGRFYGAGFKGMPLAKLNDGLLDVIIVRNLKRRELIPIIGRYRKGTHLEMENAFDKIIYKKCVGLSLYNASKDDYCADGEIRKGGDLEISIVPNAIQLSLPLSEIK